jgi:glycosyltransferase involved in cell wall biosynthesis
MTNTLAPRLSIGLPVYNGEKLVDKAIDVILAQTFQDFELVIADNASTDATEQICRHYAAKDDRIRYYRNSENLGLARNHDRILELAQAPYFKVLHADDSYAPTFLEQCVAALDANPDVVLAYAKTMLIDEDGHEIGPMPTNLHSHSDRPSDRFQQFHASLHDYKNSHPFNANFGVIRTDVLRQTSWHGRFISADTIFLVELLLRGKFYEVPEFLFYRRMHNRMSLVANPDFNRLIRVLDPQKQGNLVFPHWRLVVEFLKAIQNAPISAIEKLNCYTPLQQWIWWKKRVLFRELMVNGARSLNLQSLPFDGMKAGLPTQWY